MYSNYSLHFVIYLYNCSLNSFYNTVTVTSKILYFYSTSILFILFNKFIYFYFIFARNLIKTHFIPAAKQHNKSLQTLQSYDRNRPLGAPPKTLEDIEK